MPATRHPLTARMLHEVTLDGAADGQLLQRFVRRRDEAAFAALVRRHGPMVLAVCRRVLGNDADAEDAFQATFLVLARRATSLADRTVLGDWLHGVARRTALKARTALVRRRERERAAARPAVEPSDARNDWVGLLDDALRHLPEKHRLPVVLCDLEGRTRREAAEQLGWPEGTVAGRLARGRALLARRLLCSARVGVLPASLAAGTARAALSPNLIGTAARQATLLTAGGTVDAATAALAGEVLRPGPSRVKVGALLALAVLGVGLGVFRFQLAPPNPPEADPPTVPKTEVARAEKKVDNIRGRWKVKEADATGKHQAYETDADQTWEITADRIVIQYGNGERDEWSYTLDPSASPWAIDLNGGGRLAGRKALGVCERTGDTLRICYHGGERPARCDINSIGESRSARFFVLEPQREPQDNPPGAVTRLGSLRLAHQDNASCAAYSPDGKTLATGGHDSYVRFWDSTTGRELRALRHFGWVRALAWTPDGKTLYSASDGEGVRTWDVATGSDTRIHTTKAMVTALILSRDGKTLAFCEHENTVVVRDVPGSRERFRFQAEERAYRVAISPDGRTLAVGGEPRKVLRRDVFTGRELPPLEGHTAGTYSVAFSPDGKLLASGGTYPDGTILLWDAATGKELRRWKAAPGAVYALTFSPDGKALLSGHGSDYGPPRLWDPATGRELRSFRTVAHGPSDALAFTPDGKRVASVGCWERGVYLWDVATGDEVSPFPRHHGEVNSVAFSPDGKLLATGSADRTVGLWDPASGKPAGRIRGHRGPVRGIVFAPDGRLVASTAERETVVQLCSPETGAVVRELAGGRSEFHCLAFSPDGQTVAAGEATDSLRLSSGARAPDGAVWLWSVATGKEIRRLSAGAGRVNSVAFSPDGRLLATTGIDDNAIHLWDVQTGAERARLPHKTDPAAPQAMFEGTSALAFSPDGRALASVSYYEYKSNKTPISTGPARDIRAVTIWEIAGRKVRYEIALPRNRACSVSFLGTRYLAIGCRDGSVRLRDLGRDEWLEPACGHRDAVTSLAVSPDRQTLASGSRDTSALVWRIDSLVGRRLPLPAVRRDELEKLREDLSGDDAVKAYRAVRALSGSAESVKMLAEHVRPVVPRYAERVRRLVNDLDSDEFRVREEATVKLESFGELVAPELRKALSSKPSAEVRRRLEQLLARIESGQEERLAARVTEVLEERGTAEARQLLEKLAKGAPAARLTEWACGALKRMSSAE